jgi:hypothetical protein
VAADGVNVETDEPVVDRHGLNSQLQRQTSMRQRLVQLPDQTAMERANKRQLDGQLGLSCGVDAGLLGQGGSTRAPLERAPHKQLDRQRHQKLGRPAKRSG